MQRNVVVYLGDDASKNVVVYLIQMFQNIVSLEVEKKKALIQVVAFHGG